jgi:hypothetical protein
MVNWCHLDGSGGLERDLLERRSARQAFRLAAAGANTKNTTATNRTAIRLIVSLEFNWSRAPTQNLSPRRNRRIGAR